MIIFVTEIKKLYNFKYYIVWKFYRLSALCPCCLELLIKRTNKIGLTVVMTGRESVIGTMVLWKIVRDKIVVSGVKLYKL